MSGVFRAALGTIPDMPKQWFYSVGGESRGPFSPEQMRALVASRTIDGTTLIWSSPMPEWLPLARTEFAQHSAQPAASPSAPPPTAAPTAAPAGGSTRVSPTHITVGGTSIAVPDFIREQASPDFLNAIQTCLGKYTDFSGRAARPEYWWFYLFNLIVIIAAAILDGIVSFVVSLSIFQIIATLALLVPMLAASTRRLHDLGKSGWIQLIALTIVGIIPLIYWLCQPGDPQTNQYGPPPTA